MKSPAPYSLAVADPARRPVIVQGAGDGAASHVRRETRADGVLYVVGPDGIAQPCANAGVAVRVEASVRNLTRA